MSESEDEGYDSNVSCTSDASEIKRQQRAILQQEKFVLTNKIRRVSSSTGITHRMLSKDLSKEELSAELTRIIEENALRKSIKFQRRLLLTASAGLEWAHNKTPVKGKLIGWNDSMLAHIEDFDRVFERLHDKHAPKYNADGTPGKQMEPELELLYMMSYSAFTFGVTNSIISLTTQQQKSVIDVAKERTVHANKDSDAFKAATTTVDTTSFLRNISDTIPIKPTNPKPNTAIDKVTLEMA